MSHLLNSKRGHDSEDEEYSQTDVTSDDDLSYYTDDEGTHADDSDAEEQIQQPPQEEVETDEAVVISKGKEPATIQEPPTEQINYQDLDSEEVKEKRIQEHRDYRRKLAEDPSFVPYVGLFWGHDDRYRDDAFTETRAVSENTPHFSNNTNTSIKQYDKSMDPLMYKKWDHSGYEELLRMDEEDERRRKELIAAGELDENAEYRPNRNYQRQHSSRGRGYRQRGGYNNQGQRYQNQGYNNGHQQNRPRYQNRQEEWPELSKATTTNIPSNNNDQVLVDVSTDETSGFWKQSEPTTTQTNSGWEQPKPTTTQNNNGWGQAEPQNNNTWEQTKPTTTQDDLGQAQSTATQENNNGWEQKESTTPQTSGGWGQVESTTTQNDNGWGSNTAQTETIETNKEAESSKVETHSENNAGWGATADNTSKTTDDYHNKRGNNSRSIPSEEKASSSWANTDLYTPLPEDTQRTRSYNNNRNQERRNNYQRNDYQQRGDYQHRNDYKQRSDYKQQRNERKEETSDNFDTSALAETQGWANTSVPMAVDTDAWGAPSKDSTSNNNSWSVPAKESSNSPLKETAAVNDSWSSPAKETTTLDYWTTPATNTKDDSWSVPATDSTPKESNDSWSIPAKETPTTQNDSWSIPAKEAPTTRSWSTPPQETTTPKDSWSIPAKETVVTSNSSSAPPTDSWSIPAQEPIVEKTTTITEASVNAKPWNNAQDSWGTPTKDSTVANWETQPPAANNDSAKNESWSGPVKKEEQASWGTKKSGWEEAETSTRKSRGYLSQKMDSAPVVENVVVQPQEVEPESSTWSAFRDHDDEDSDVEIILEAEEEHEWLKDEQVLGMTAPFDASKDGKKNSNYHSYESSPRSDVNRKVNGRKPRRNFEDNWRSRDDKEEVYRNVPPAAMYYPPQPYVPMIPNANGNPMYAMSFPMGASTGGSVSPNHDSEGSPHQKYYTSPPMMNPNNMPSRFEANGMVYYGVDPNTMYQPQPYYYYVPMTGANDSSPVMHAENEGWGPSPEREEEWSRSSPSNDKNRNPHSMTYNPSYYYYPPQNPY